MSDPTEVEHCEYSSDSWVSLAEILDQPRGTDKPRVTIALLTTIIETEGIKTIGRARRIIKATSGGKSEFASEASVIDFLATYCEELDASNALPRGQHPTHDPDRWLEYESPLCKFGWPKDEVPDFAEWIARTRPKSKETPSTVLKDANSSDVKAQASKIPDECLDQDSGTPADAKVKLDNDTALSDLFDPVPVEALEKMFPAGGKWKVWTERAARNGLRNAREGRAKFNPYKAAVWFVNEGIQGWDLARCRRALANNLPARSRRDEAHLLTDSLD